MPQPTRRADRRFPRSDEASIDRRHRREDGDLSGRQAIPHHIRIELRQHLARGVHRQRASEAVQDRVDVMHRQREQDAVVGAPPPRIDEGRDLRPTQDLRGVFKAVLSDFPSPDVTMIGPFARPRM